MSQSPQIECFQLMIQFHERFLSEDRVVHAFIFMQSILRPMFAIRGLNW